MFGPRWAAISMQLHSYGGSMRRVIIGIIFVGVLLLGLSVGSVASAEADSPRQAPPINETNSPTPVSESMNTAPQQYTVLATTPAAIDTTELSTYGTIGARADARVEIKMPPANVSAIETLQWVEDVRPVVRLAPTEVAGSGDGQSLGVESLHTNGHTGDGVTVGVIDDGFETSTPELNDRVVDTRSFVMTQQDAAHGTSVAEIVTQTAPDSDLYLASASTSTQVESAIEYLVAQDVDVIVASWGYPAVEDNGEHFLTDKITQARDNDTLFVASAGNNAQRHWEGAFRSSDGDAFHEWTAAGSERNCLRACDMALSEPQTIEVYVRWVDRGQPSEYKAALYNNETNEYVATENTVADAGSNKYARLTATVDPQPLELVVENTDGAPDDDIEVIVGGVNKIATPVPESSITVPADVPAALSVAAYEPRATRIAPYSSQGPTDDGRLGIDVAGYTNIDVENGLYGQTPYSFAGTSAAAPYVGGVAALMSASTSDPSAEAVATKLQATSDDILTAGADPVAGAGVVNAVSAVEQTTASTPPALATVGGQPRDALYSGAERTAYRGQQILVTGDGIQSDTTYTLQAVDSIDNGTVTSSSSRTTLTTYTEGQDNEELPVYADDALTTGEAFLVIDTKSLPRGEYFVSGGPLPVAPDADNGTFELTVQTLDVRFGTPVLSPTGPDSTVTELEITSNRPTYTANLSAGGALNETTLLDFVVNTGLNGSNDTVSISGATYTESALVSALREARTHVRVDDGTPVINETGTVSIEAADGELNTVSVAALRETDANPFNAFVYQRGEEASTNTIVLSNISDATHDVDAAGIGPDTYEITVSAHDTDATATAPVEIATNSGSLQLQTTAAPETVTTNESFNISYAIENRGDSSTTYTLTSAVPSATGAVTGFNGTVQSTALDETPPTATTAPVAAGANASVTVTYRVAPTAVGNVTITTTARDTLSGANVSLSPVIAIQSDSPPTTPTERALQIAGKNSPSELTQNDVTAVITRFERGQSNNNLTIRQDDVTAMITLFERS